MFTPTTQKAAETMTVVVSAAVWMRGRLWDNRPEQTIAKIAGTQPGHRG